jgi:hypothetical protein
MDYINRVMSWLRERPPNVIFSVGLGSGNHRAAESALYSLFFPEGEMGEGYWILPIDTNYKRGVTAVASYPPGRCQLTVNRKSAASIQTKCFKGIYINVGKLIDQYDVDNGLIIFIGVSIFNPFKQ